MKTKTFLYLILLFIPAFIITSCRGDENYLLWAEQEQIAPGEVGEIKGFFLLNEGNMGSNKSTLDYFDYESGTYFRNIYPTVNPQVTHNLGDVGNDIQIYGDKLYAVINCSHLVEVMDVYTAEHLHTLDITNCRYIVFDKDYAYVSSYNGPVLIDPDAPIGTVVKVDTRTMQIVDKCVVGYQPEEMVIHNNKLYVANSGGYRVPEYDTTVSVIDLETFTEIKKIEVGINLHRLELDNYGYLYVSSRGDYKKIGSKTFIIDTRTDEVVKTLGLLPNSNMELSGDSLYVYSVEWSHITQSNTVTYAIFDTKQQRIVTRKFIKDGTEKRIKVPYGIAVNPVTKDFFTTDAKDYVSPGTLYCFKRNGVKKWSVMTGDIPAHIVFTDKRMTNLDLLSKNKIQ
ncbi:hypothetical protein Bcop_2010 [Bacteroides coprosuis DSM 18011]|uniref:Lipoprotein n=1 Tax=Bacteroides coprosuis DSM 18011 TaxID=679937 RepID=F3ZSU4_9BACE|nr:DUF5074 domain-containing protein [Bacteroides coprosuis]EGJ72185.1 hypothetical protein Bcop_2010 [Bacteroides coprosuis DSM 18011]